MGTKNQNSFLLSLSFRLEALNLNIIRIFPPSIDIFLSFPFFLIHYSTLPQT